MIFAILCLAILEIVLGGGVFASAKSSIHEVLGMNFIGFGVVTFGVAVLQWELRTSRREAAKERQAALEDRQARAALDLKQRSGLISSIDRQQRQTGIGDTAAAAKPGTVCSDPRDPDAGPAFVRAHSSAQFRGFPNERRQELLTSCATVGYISGPPFHPLQMPPEEARVFTRQVARRQPGHRRFPY